MPSLSYCCYTCGKDNANAAWCRICEQAIYCSEECRLKDASHLSKHKKCELTLRSIHVIANTVLKKFQEIPFGHMLNTELQMDQFQLVGVEASTLDTPEPGYYPNCIELYLRALHLQEKTGVKKLVVHALIRRESPKGVFTTHTMLPFLFSLHEAPPS